MIAEKTAGNGSAVQNGTIISDMLHGYVETLKAKDAGERAETK